MSSAIDLSDVKNVLRGIDKLLTAEQIGRVLLITGRKLGVAGEAIVSTYPPASRKPLARFYVRTTAFGRPTRPYLSKFKSDKQAWKVINLGKQGKIPYSRTGTLARSITSEARLVDPAVVETAIGTNLRYAPLVIDEARQSHYHKGTWKTLQADLRDNTDRLNAVTVKTFLDEIVKALP